MTKVLQWLAPALAVVAMIFAIGIGNNVWPAITYAPDMAAAAGRVAGALFVVALFLERALSVINDLVFGDEETDAVSNLRTAMLSVAHDRNAQLANASWRLDVISDAKQRLRLGLGFLASVFIAGAGVRTFSGLLQISNTCATAASVTNGLITLTCNQLTLLNTMDIILTAGLLAGGSNGIAAIIERLIKQPKASGMLTRFFPAQTDEYTALRMARAGLRPTVSPLTTTYLSAPSAAFTAGIAIDDLGLIEPALTGAQTLLAQCPAVVFTSGLRAIADQARIMAANIVKSGRTWIQDTYKASSERDALQKWVDDNPTATTEKALAAGLLGIMQDWSEDQKYNFSRHLAGLAFDVSPTDVKILAAMKKLPGIGKVLESEGGLTIWHAQFDRTA